MSQENVEVVRRSVEAAFRDDWDTVRALCDPGIEWVEMPSLGPDAATYVGIERLRGAVGSWLGMWSEYRLDHVRYLDVNEEVVALSRESGSGGTSGASVERKLGQVFSVRDGRVVRVRLYGSWVEALEAVGLRE